MLWARRPLISRICNGPIKNVCLFCRKSISNKGNVDSLLLERYQSEKQESILPLETSITQLKRLMVKPHNPTRKGIIVLYGIKKEGKCSILVGEPISEEVINNISRSIVCEIA